MPLLAGTPGGTVAAAPPSPTINALGGAVGVTAGLPLTTAYAAVRLAHGKTVVFALLTVR